MYVHCALARFTPGVENVADQYELRVLNWTAPCASTIISAARGYMLVIGGNRVGTIEVCAAVTLESHRRL
jgi:hypothetical protein